VRNETRGVGIRGPREGLAQALRTGDEEGEAPGGGLLDPAFERKAPSRWSRSPHLWYAERKRVACSRPHSSSIRRK
jgi:hypothetical protein